MVLGITHVFGKSTLKFKRYLSNGQNADSVLPLHFRFIYARTKFFQRFRIPGSNVQQKLEFSGKKLIFFSLRGI